MSNLRDRAALLVLDTQNGFCEAGGSSSRIGRDVAECRSVIPACSALISAARDSHVPVIYCVTELEPARTAPGSLGAIASAGGLAPGSWDAGVVQSLQPHPGDHRITKHRWNAFYGTPLDSLLFELAIETVIAIGVLTNLSVQSTVRDASHRDYRAYVVADATADIDPKSHSGALRALEWAFCKLVSTEQVVGAWHSGGTLGPLPR